MKKPCALVSNVKNEAVILPLWLSYYTRFFDPVDIYVGDDSSTDSTVSILNSAGVNIDTIAGYNGPRKHKHLISHIRGKATDLLREYETILFVESDEFVVPVAGSLREFIDLFAAASATCKACQRFGSDKCGAHQMQVCTNLEIIQDIASEPELDLSKPIMAQRSHALNVPKFNNAQLWGVAPRWSEGYHDVDGSKPEASGTIWLVHLHHIDFKLCNERHKARKRLVDNIVFAVEEDAELETFFRTKLNDPGMYYNGPVITEIPPEVKSAF